MKVGKTINLAQLTEELLPLGVNSLVYDSDSDELKIKSGSASESDVRSIIDAHIPKKIKTRAEKRKDLENATTLNDLKKAILEII